MSGSTPIAAGAIASECRPSFTSGGEVFREIQRDVEAVLARKGIRTRALIQLHLKTAIAVTTPIAAWIVLMTASPGLYLGLACLLLLAAGAVLVAFCVQHDANHGASFGSRRYNRIVGFSADAMLGFSSYAWRVKHNVAHHTYTNVDAYDDDISQVPLARLPPAQSSKPWYRLQHYYIWPMYSLMVLRMQAFGDVAALLRGRIGRSKLRMPRGWDLAGLVSGKLVYLSWAVVIPLFIYPWWVASSRLHRPRDDRRTGHGHDLPARALRRRGELPLERRARRRERPSGPCTRSSPRSTSARATRC